MFPSKRGETCSCVLTHNEVESRHIFRQRRYFLRTSNSSRKRWNFLQVLWSGRSCEICSWRTQSIYSKKQYLKSWSKIVKLILLTLSFVNFNVNFQDKLITIVWTWKTWIAGVKNLEGSSRYSYPKSLRWKKWRELRTWDLTKSQYINWEKVTLKYRSSLHKDRSCRKEWMLSMILENFMISNLLAVANYPTFLVSRQLFQVLVGCWVATEA